MAMLLTAVSTQEAAGASENDFEKELCKDRSPGEWFRLVASQAGDECRNVIQCTSSVRPKININKLFFPNSSISQLYY
jgi:hypothetical protein